MKAVFKIFMLAIILTAFSVVPLFAQINDTIDEWDNQMFISNKVAWSKEQWRYTGEFQVRLENNTRDLQLYLVEGVATYMPNSKWEIVPDLRFSVYSNKVEIRPGFGVIRKQYWEKKHKNQLAHQMKYQADIETTGIVKHGFRYIVFHNVVLSEKFLISSALGGFYRWSDAFTGAQFARAMTGVGYSFDKQHIISLSYFVGAENRGDYTSFIGGPVVQLVIRFDDDYKYVPAKYISF